ncbi:GDSL-type esterase/lipase family protein [Mucilaginibacter sp. AW1-3]
MLKLKMGHCKKTLLFLLFLCLISRTWAQAPSCSVASKFYSKDSIIVTTFGASTVAGINGFSFQPYLQQNFQYCYTGKYISITNWGVSGETTTQGLARFDLAIAGRTGFVCILMGLNDALLIANTPGLTTSKINAALKTTQQNMQAMIEKCLKNNLIPIIGTLQFVNDKGNPTLKTTNSYVTRINAGYKSLVKQNHIYLADINAAMGRNFQLYQADGLHPNAQGDKLIGYVWFDAINAAIESKLLLVGLSQNFPNPAANTATIGFSLSESGKVNMQLYSMTGAVVKNILANEFYNSGYHEVTVTLSGLSPGVYVYVMQVAGRQLSKKMIVAK